MRISDTIGAKLADPFFGIRHQGAELRAQLRGAVGRGRAAVAMGPRPHSPHFGRHSGSLPASHGGLKGLGPHHRGHR